MTPLRVAFATPEYVTEEYFDGGLANYIHRVARALAEMGHDIHVLTFSEIDEARFEHDGVTVHRIKSSTWLPDLTRFTRYPMSTAPMLLDFSFKVYRKLKWLNAQRPLHLVQFPTYSCCGLASIYRLKVPHVLRASSYQPLLNEAAGVTPTVNSKIVGRMEALQLRMSSHVFAPSYHLQQILEREARLTRVRVIRTPFYVETTDWDSSVYDRCLMGKQYLLFFGRFQLHKGFHNLVEALPRVLDQYPNAHAALVGRDMESPLAPSMADYARQRCGAFAERVVVMDRLQHRQLYPVIAGAHLVVLPSLIENLPNAGLEAMGLGKVVIGTVGTSFEELISDGVTGFLATPNNPESLAEKIISAWIHPQLGDIGAAARQASLEFSPEKTVVSLLNYYREVLRA